MDLGAPYFFPQWHKGFVQAVQLAMCNVLLGDCISESIYFLPWVWKHFKVSTLKYF